MVNTSDFLPKFLHTLRQSGFKGDCETAYGARIVASTDNSIYQVIPEAILYPANAEDINAIVTSVAQQPNNSISITPRGGGTGTNGQSLNHSVIVDTSRYLNNIIHFDETGRRVRVEPVLVKAANNFNVLDLDF